jgi:hypothetical protein
MKILLAILSKYKDWFIEKYSLMISFKIINN